MKLKIQSVFSNDFLRYGKVLEGYDTKELLSVLEEKTPLPLDSVVYEPTDSNLESLSIAKDFSLNAYGGMPIQLGYCNGFNTKLNCFEYHRGSELNIPSRNMILLLASVSDIHNGRISSKCTKAFRVPAGTVVQVYETTLHYAPCCDVHGDDIASGFRVVIVLPKDTNTAKPDIVAKNNEDKMLRAKNKWLLAHPSSAEAKSGAYVGLTGNNIDLSCLN